MSAVEIVQEILSNGWVRALMVVIGAAAAAAPILRVRHDWLESKLREREVRAKERQAKAIEKIGRVIEDER